MSSNNRKILAAIVASVFILSTVTGVAFSVSPTTVILRAMGMAFAAGMGAGLIIVIFERIWVK